MATGLNITSRAFSLEPVGGRGYGKPVTDQAVLTVPDVRVIRDEPQRLVLLGPLGGERKEFSREDPLDRYPLGRLAPSGTEAEPDMQDDLADGADELIDDHD